MRHGLQEPRAEQRNHRHRDDERRQQRQTECQRQSGEQELADAVEEGDGEEVDHVHESSGQNGEIDFGAARFGGDTGATPISRCR